MDGRGARAPVGERIDRSPLAGGVLRAARAEAMAGLHYRPGEPRREAAAASLQAAERGRAAPSKSSVLARCRMWLARG